jgi:hypothetical protein
MRKSSIRDEALPETVPAVDAHRLEGRSIGREQLQRDRPVARLHERLDADLVAGAGHRREVLLGRVRVAGLYRDVVHVEDPLQRRFVAAGMASPHSGTFVVPADGGGGEHGLLRRRRCR